MKHLLGVLAGLVLSILAVGAARAAEAPSVLGLSEKVAAVADRAPDWRLEARFYHAGAKGLRALDSLGCKVAPMRTVAVDRTLVPRRSIIFIKETVGLPLPGGGVHDGLWYASDIGGSIKGAKVDLFTGAGAGSMAPLMKAGLNLAKLTVSKVGDFTGCPPVDLG